MRAFAEDFGGEPRRTCFSCGHDKFRLAVDGDCPRGCTIQAVVCEPAHSGRCTTVQHNSSIDSDNGA